MSSPKGKTLYEQIGEDRLRELVKTFYDLVETDPNEGAIIHALHLKGLGINHLRAAQLEFLTGFFGGPKFYVERTGHSDIRQIHAHVEIGYKERDAWLVCMDKAIDQVGFEPELKERLMLTFTRAAEMSRNQD
jgi:hemoglobin